MIRNKPTAEPRRGERLSLVAFLNGVRVGDIYQTSSGTLRFVYKDQWRDNSGAYPLSLSMPLTAVEHGDEAISPFLWGLLPDSDRTLDHYGRLFGVSARNPVALLSHMGADCAGAVQFAPPERADVLEGPAPNAPTVEWLTHAEIARELKTVREQGIPGTTRRTVGQFSLAGAQPKIALLEEKERWGRPTGRTPTNRILKPPSEEFRGFAENEHLCLGLASSLGLAAVRSRVMRFEDEVAIVVERFDRAKRGRVYYRIHQEDICQALGVMPTRKYENEGGPGVKDTITLLRDASRNPQEDVQRFLGATILTWVIAGTDAHAKNYALLHSPAGIRLAPFYDIVSYLPYADPGLHRVKLAMKIGGTYIVRRINRISWETLAKDNVIPVEYILDNVAQVLQQLPSALEAVTERATKEGLDTTIIDPLAARILQRATECAGMLVTNPAVSTAV
ncbi:MAG: type II toxin-antitoxin system HipA family toxin [Gemmatimonadaceae bacterium]